MARRGEARVGSGIGHAASLFDRRRHCQQPGPQPVAPKARAGTRGEHVQESRGRQARVRRRVVEDPVHRLPDTVVDGIALIAAQQSPAQVPGIDIAAQRSEQPALGAMSRRDGARPVPHCRAEAVGVHRAGVRVGEQHAPVTGVDPVGRACRDQRAAACACSIGSGRDAERAVDTEGEAVHGRRMRPQLERRPQVCGMTGPQPHHAGGSDGRRGGHRVHAVVVHARVAGVPV